MKRIALLGLLLTLSVGCGKGWLPSLRGASCRGGCLSAPAALPAPKHSSDCATCVDGGYASGYSNYTDRGEVIADTGYYGSGVISNGYPAEGYVNDGYVLPGNIVEGTLVQPSVAPPAN
ncbi:MAG: hypothetical protein R3C53_07455 [Pirellulaceae bacterium]